MAGAVNARQGCRLHEAGNCTAAAGAVDFCQGGSRFVCPRGMKLRSSPTPDLKNVANCVPCDAGESCLTSEPVECLDGYICLAGTKSPKVYPAPAGTHIPTTASKDPAPNLPTTTIVNSVGPTHDGGYSSPGATESSDTYKDGYRCTLGPSENPAAACPPTAGGADASSEWGVTCHDGYYCPEATRTAEKRVPCHPGTKHDGTQAASKEHCGACAEGVFCAEATTASAG